MLSQSIDQSILCIPPGLNEYLSFNICCYGFGTRFYWGTVSYWGLVIHIWGYDLSPVQFQAITWSNDHKFSVATPETNLGEILKLKYIHFIWRKWISECCNFVNFVQGLVWCGIGPLTHWPLGNLNEILDMSFFKQILMISGWGISCEIALIWMSLDLNDDQIIISSGNGLVPSGNKPLPEPMLT